MAVQIHDGGKDTEMTALDLYEEIKSAASFLGLGFADLDDVFVSASNGRVYFTFGDRQCSVLLPDRDADK